MNVRQNKQRPIMDHNAAFLDDTDACDNPNAFGGTTNEDWYL